MPVPIGILSHCRNEFGPTGTSHVETKSSPSFETLPNPYECNGPTPMPVLSHTLRAVPLFNRDMFKGRVKAFAMISSITPITEKQAVFPVTASTHLQKISQVLMHFVSMNKKFLPSHPQQPQYFNSMRTLKT